MSTQSSQHGGILSPVLLIELMSWLVIDQTNLLLLFLISFTRNKESLQEVAATNVNKELLSALLTTGTVVFTLFQILRYVKALKEPTASLDGISTEPMLFPCRTSHRRFFPTKHSFEYSYLLAGVPVGWKGSVGGMLSVDGPAMILPWYRRIFSLKHGAAWHVVSGDDYLARGHHANGLKGKLRDFLQTQGVDHKEYPYAYLVTAPRFLGYYSNPVSLWYLYSATKELSALILEVNNTFGERHSYFLKPSRSSSKSTDEPKSPRFTGQWPKDFYVSVFNSRAGSYSLSANDPFYPSMTGPGLIDATITLSSSTGSPKLIARLFSTSPGIPPSTMTLLQKTHFLAANWWIGLATFPRTVAQALTILTTKKLPWVFRPEPRKDTIARDGIASELLIERLFRRYLRHAVENAEESTRVTYTPAGLVDLRSETMRSPSPQLSAPAAPQALDIRVLTPLFYSRFARYASVAEALRSESGSATVALSGSAPLDLLVATAAASPVPTATAARRPPWKYALISYLRRRPEPITCAYEKPPDPAPILSPPAATDAGTCSGLTGFENFILSHATAAEEAEYANHVLKILGSEYVAFGWLEILGLEIFLLRAAVLWWLVGRFLIWGRRG